MNILITGGAGYIGSHMVWALVDAGITPVVVDDLSTGHKGLLPKSIPFYEGCISDEELIEKIITTHNVDTVIHFAGSIRVEESVSNPEKYYTNNTAYSKLLIDNVKKLGVKRFIFSSTAAVYGEVTTPNPVTEDYPKKPANPYGESKLLVEEYLQEVANDGFNYGILRYFNVAGADIQGRTGQQVEDATSLLKVTSEVASGKRKKLLVYGDDYPTKDGTAVRDYIHVCDLVDIHKTLAQHMQNHSESFILNCGYGVGYSIKEVLAVYEKVVGAPVPYEIAPRRAGDVASVISNVEELHKTLSWQPSYNNLEIIIKTAYEWETQS